MKYLILFLICFNLHAKVFKIIEINSIGNQETTWDKTFTEEKSFNCVTIWTDVPNLVDDLTLQILDAQMQVTSTILEEIAVANDKSSYCFNETAIQTTDTVRIIYDSNGPLNTNFWINGH